MSGFGSPEVQETRIVPISLYVPRLNRSFDLHAEFGQIPKKLGVAGLLGHRGFLDPISITFAFGEYFVIVDDSPCRRHR